MRKCPVDGHDLRPAYTKQGVEIDICPSCKGIWLDKDEIYHFINAPTYVRAKMDEALKKQRPTDRKSPVSGENMVALDLFDGGVTVDYCLKSEGIWLDKGEIQRFPRDKGRIEIDRGVSDIEQPVTPAGADAPLVELFPLPNLAASSASVLFGMYAILTLVLISVVQFTDLTALSALLIGIGIAVFQFLLGPFFMDLSLSWLYRLRWAKPEELPTHLREFVTRVCEKEGIRFPRMGIITDGSPQAFTYGHHPNNGRIVISQGLIDLLQEKEVEAVVAHEIGHMVHWDMLVMTIAQLVPLLLYYIYRTLIRMRSRGREDKSAAARYAIAIAAYVLYIISEYIVLWFSRIREYYADRYAGQTTGKPENLATALVKIGYGLAGRQSEKSKKDTARSDAMNGLQPLGIFNAKHANMLAMSGYTGPQKMGGDIDKQTLKDVAKWDLWNPWAAFYELHSTHPLIAKRIKMLSNLSKSMGRPPYIEFNEQKPESYWDSFLLDVVIYTLPTLAFIGGFGYLFYDYVRQLGASELYSTSTTLPTFSYAFFVLLLGICFLSKTFYCYASSDFAPMNIRALLKKIRVSAVNPVPCKVKGTIIGRGVPGLIYSEDFVLQDETGIIFLDYQQPIAFFNFWFGLLRAARYHNQEAEIVGWYRRAPVPYIEIRELNVGGKTSTCYVYHMKLFGSFLLIAMGIILLFL